MSENKKLENEDKKNFDPSETIGFYVTAVWLAFWFGTLYVNVDFNDLKLGDIGAYIAGIFAPVAWLWFYLSYRLQRQSLDKQIEELGLQRKELTLQRQAIEQSTLAQQGSEQALKEQSKALNAQLSITQQQFKHYVTAMEGKKPLYKLIKYKRFATTKDYLYDEYGVNPYRPASRDVGGQNKVEYLSLVFKIKNVAGDANLKEIEPIISNESAQNFKLLIDAQTYGDFFDLELLVLPRAPFRFNNPSYHSEYEKMIDSLRFRILYSYSEGSSQDIYKFNMNDGKPTIDKVSDTD